MTFSDFARKIETYFEASLQDELRVWVFASAAFSALCIVAGVFAGHYTSALVPVFVLLAVYGSLKLRPASIEAAVRTETIEPIFEGESDPDFLGRHRNMQGAAFVREPEL